MNPNLSTCNECGMAVSPGEYHPFAACLMFKGCHDGDQVRVNLAAVRGYVAQPDPAMAGQEWATRLEDLLVEFIGGLVTRQSVMAHARKRVQPAEPKHRIGENK